MLASAQHKCLCDRGRVFKSARICDPSGLRQQNPLSDCSSVRMERPAGALLLLYNLSPHPAVAAEDLRRGEAFFPSWRAKCTTKCQWEHYGYSKAVHQVSVKSMSRDKSHLTTTSDLAINSLLTNLSVTL